MGQAVRQEAKDVFPSDIDKGPFRCRSLAGTPGIIFHRQGGWFFRADGTRADIGCDMTDVRYGEASMGRLARSA
jgi:hypothetical protein